MKALISTGLLLILPCAHAGAQTSWELHSSTSPFAPTALDLALSTAESSTPVDPTPAFIPLPKYGPWVGTAKWITLGSAAGLGALGFKLHRDADNLFRQLEARCADDPDNCRERTERGAYADPALEDLFQRVENKDALARVALISSQVSFGASVVLFIVDFGKGRGPDDVPYDPPESKGPLSFRLQPGELSLIYHF